MKFFNVDLHQSVIEDLIHIFESLGHEITSWNMTPKVSLFGRTPHPNGIVTYDNLTEFSDEICDQFYNTYKDELDQYDGFIVTCYTCFSMLFRKWNKPIIAYMPDRYEEPFITKPNRWHWLNLEMLRMIESGQLKVVSNNLYDAKYFEAFTGVEVPVIANPCLYMDVIKYNPIRDKYLWCSWGSLYANHPLFDNVKFNFDWTENASYKANVHIPYNISVMKYIEQYRSNIPLFFPTIDHLWDLMRRHTSPMDRIMSNLSYTLIRDIEAKSTIPYMSEFDPNNYRDEESVKFWLQYADFYNPNIMPYVQLFDDFDDLLVKIQACDLTEISRSMSIFNAQQRQEAIHSWYNLISEL